MTMVKVCGLTRLEDAVAAAEAGADLLGFVFAPSPRRIDPAAARAFWRRLPRGVPTVAVFRDQPLAEVERVTGMLRPDYVQLHGAERPAYCRVVGRPVIRALSARTPEDLALAEAFAEVAELFLVDLPKEEGGTEIDAEVARLAGALPRPVLLAGNLDPASVGAFVARHRPFGVDVARGVEAAPGVKDHDKVRAFVAAAKATPATPLPPEGEGRVRGT